jgi:hypothetical protein
VVETLSDLVCYVSMDEGHPIAPFHLVILSTFGDAPSNSISIRVYVFIGWIVTRIVSYEKISIFFDRIEPREPELIIPLVELRLQRPLEIKLKVIILPKRRSIAQLSTQSSSTVTVDVLLNLTKQRTLLFSFNVNTRIVPSIVDCFHSLLYDHLILLMRKFIHLQFFLALSSHNTPEIFLFLLHRQIQKLQLLIVLFLQIVDLLFSLGPKVHIHMLVKF